jgi:hypothetical protein
MNDPSNFIKWTYQQDSGHGNRGDINHPTHLPDSFSLYFQNNQKVDKLIYVQYPFNKVCDCILFPSSLINPPLSLSLINWEIPHTADRRPGSSVDIATYRLQLYLWWPGDE